MSSVNRLARRNRTDQPPASRGPWSRFRWDLWLRPQALALADRAHRAHQLAAAELLEHVTGGPSCIEADTATSSACEVSISTWVSGR
jgi:hypothetical protein